jgi:predicted HicB family RNase H-like nuclease
MPRRKPPIPLVRLSVLVNPEEHAILDARAELEGCSMAQIVRRLLREMGAKKNPETS